MSVHYVGVAFSTGEEFDASCNRGAPLDFPLGAGRVIKGWDRAWRNEGRRPAQAGHPTAPRLRRPRRGWSDRPGETLIFVVDLVDVS